MPLIDEYHYCKLHGSSRLVSYPLLPCLLLVSPCLSPLDCPLIDMPHRPFQILLRNSCVLPSCSLYLLCTSNPCCLPRSYISIARPARIAFLFTRWDGAQIFSCPRVAGLYQIRLCSRRKPQYMMTSPSNIYRLSRVLLVVFQQGHHLIIMCSHTRFVARTSLHIQYRGPVRGR